MTDLEKIRNNIKALIIKEPTLKNASNTHLAIRYYEIFHSLIFFSNEEGLPVSADYFDKNYPSVESITRMRRKLCNTEMPHIYGATEPNVKRVLYNKQVEMNND